jgi:hypothetical protein
LPGSAGCGTSGQNGSRGSGAQRQLCSARTRTRWYGRRGGWSELGAVHGDWCKGSAEEYHQCVQLQDFKSLTTLVPVHDLACGWRVSTHCGMSERRSSTTTCRADVKYTSCNSPRCGITVLAKVHCLRSADALKLSELYGAKVRQLLRSAHGAACARAVSDVWHQYSEPGRLPTHSAGLYTRIWRMCVSLPFW